MWICYTGIAYIFNGDVNKEEEKSLINLLHEQDLQNVPFLFVFRSGNFCLFGIRLVTELLYNIIKLFLLESMCIVIDENTR